MPGKPKPAGDFLFSESPVTQSNAWVYPGINPEKGVVDLSARTEAIENKAEALLLPLLEEMNYEFVDLEYVKEAGTWYLRAYADKEGGITVDDCEIISRAFEEKLDAADLIEEAYILEVSSPGLGRPLKKERDYVRAMGQRVEIRTYKIINHEKEFTGVLQAYDDQSVTIVSDEDEQEMIFQKPDIALIRMAFDF
ncbi:MAG: ribosome maturation factor RimP [Eubacterium sp.]|nr:ribosome maturation factor RimP [Eubacterium sp.]